MVGKLLLVFGRRPKILPPGGPPQGYVSVHTTWYLVSPQSE